ncbi:hypothetical protein Vadar_026823 [Vaccinium darrowii]|uniref:Uncharacterized protein n=1 Tax=Vaccinium darrowii TaxID=229202 RepID=A0ACB7ZDZ5_9ERIC|nr:hypothetical protein Vadar_026823 [Vaccinium darrowii]
MAQLSSFSTALTILFVVLAVFSATTASVQGVEMAPAPAPSTESGSAYSLPIPGAILFSSLILSLIALVKQ